MGFLNNLFSGVDDVARGDLGMFDDLSRMDFSGAEDRMDGNLMNIMENDSMRTVGLPIADFFSLGMASTAAKAKYNKLKYGQSGMEWGDLAKSMAGNYLGNEFLPATSANNLQGVGYNVAAGAGRGALSAGIQGNSMTQGARAGAVQGGVLGGGSYLGSMFGSESSPYSEGIDSIPQNTLTGGFGSASPSASTTYSANGDTSTYGFSPSKETYQMGNNKTGAMDSSSSGSGGLSQGFHDFINALTPNSPSRFGDVAQGLAGLYSGYRRNRAAKEMRNMIGGNRGAYEQNLRSQLQARDAASGRRSNYAGRETELQASLAQLDARNAPALSQLNEARYSGLDNMMRSGLQMGANLGWFGNKYSRPEFSMTSVPKANPLTMMPEMPVATPMTLNEMGPGPGRMPRRVNGGWEY